MKIQQKQFVDTNLALVDKATGNPIEATFSDLQLSSSDESIFTANTDVNTDGEIDVVGIAPGAGVLNVKANASYTDANTGETVTVSKEANIEVTITAGPQDAEMIVTFSDPQPVPLPEL